MKFLKSGLLGACALSAAAGLLSSPNVAHAQSATAAAAQPAAIEGTWIPETYSERLFTTDGATPPLNAEGAALYAERSAQRGDRDRQYDRTVWCAGAGIPRLMFMPYPFEIRADGEYVGFVYGWYRWHRVVDMTNAPVDPILPKTMGYPLGNWESDTLVVKTVGLSDETILDAMGLPQSDEMTLTERVRALPDGRLEVRFTIDDPRFYSRPWDAVMTYRRASNVIVGDDVCPDRLVAGQPSVRSTLP